MKKRLLSILLVAAMVVAMVPAMVVATSAESTVRENSPLLLELSHMDKNAVVYSREGVSASSNYASGINKDANRPTAYVVNGSGVSNGWGGYGVNTNLPLTTDSSYTIEYYVKMNGSTGVFAGLTDNLDWPCAGANVQVRMNGDIKNYYKNADVYYRTDGSSVYGRSWGVNVWNTMCDEDGYVRFVITIDKGVLSFQAGHKKLDVSWNLENCKSGAAKLSAFSTKTLAFAVGFVNAGTYTKPANADAILDVKNISIYEGVVDPFWDKDEIVLKTTDDFVAFQNQIINGNKFVGKTVKLGADIDFAGKALATVGNNTKNSAIGFYGVLDGQFHTLSNFSTPAQTANGLLGSLKGDSDTHVQIKNLGIFNYTASGNRTATFYGYVNAKLTFENVYVNAAINGTNGSSKEYAAGYIGNVVGIGDVAFKNCVFDGSVAYSGYGGSGFVGAINHETGGSGQPAATTNPVTFENCVVAGTFYNNKDTQASRCYFVGSWGKVTTGEYVNCIQYNDYYQTGNGVASAVCPELTGIGSGLTAVTPDGFTARNTSYPVPTTLLPFFADSVNEAHTSGAGAADLTVEYSKAQERVEEDGTLSVRLIGAVNVENAEDLQNYKAVGFEVVAIRNENAALWNNGATEVYDVYTGYLEGEDTVTAETAGGDYVFVYALEGIQANKGIVTFAIKTFYVDAEGTTVYTDMYVLDYNTAR